MSDDETIATAEWQRLRYQTYLDERRSLVAEEREQSKLFDKSLITLGSGALGLSLSFIHEILGSRVPKAPLLLGVGWFLLIVSIVATLLSFHISVKAHQRQREILDSENAPAGTAKISGNACADLVGKLTWAALGTLSGGIASLAIFIELNVINGG